MRQHRNTLQLNSVYIQMMSLLIPEGDICQFTLHTQGYSVSALSWDSEYCMTFPQDEQLRKIHPVILFLFTGYFLLPLGYHVVFLCGEIFYIQLIGDCVYLFHRDDSIANLDNTVCPRR